jgi:hypothetical protein
MPQNLVFNFYFQEVVEEEVAEDEEYLSSEEESCEEEDVDPTAEPSEFV